MKVLLPIDGSETSNEMLKWAASTMDKGKVRFYLLSILTDPMIAEYKVEDADKALEKGREFLKNQGFTVMNTSYMTGDPVDLICRYAEENDMDLVLAGSHGRSGIAKILMGSVSEGLLKQCKCPVTVFRHDLEHQMTADLL